jgi:hypothetical protein
LAGEDDQLARLLYRAANEELNMSLHKIYTDNPNLSDVTLARQLGQRLWAENDLQLDFSGIRTVTAEFATELCRTIIQRRDPALLPNALLIATMAPPVQLTFFSVLSAALSGSLGPAPAPAPEPPDSEEASTAPALDLRNAFNPISALRSIQEAYLQYVYTFQKFTNANIAGWVQDKIRAGTLLWRDPYIQLTRRFEPGDSFADLVGAGLLHPETPRYFGGSAGSPVQLYRHQSDAIKNILGVSGSGLGNSGSGKSTNPEPRTPSNVIIATGTGSGKSFCFGIPIISECLRLRDRGVRGIKAIIIYPMNPWATASTPTLPGGCTAPV